MSGQADNAGLKPVAPNSQTRPHLMFPRRLAWSLYFLIGSRLSSIPTSATARRESRFSSSIFPLLERTGGIRLDGAFFASSQATARMTSQVSRHFVRARGK